MPDRDESRLADTPEAEAQAAKFGVAPDIHADDFIYHHHIDAQRGQDPDRARAHVVEYYFSDGDRSARRLDQIIREHHPHAGTRKLALLEFASGYGCVSRHLARMHDRYDLVACDIHPQAVDFLAGGLGVAALLSRSRPAEFAQERRYDVVFCLSFFSHMPDSSFGDWISALFATLADDGLLIFTSHGRQAQIDLEFPTLQPEGYWFNAISEQKDLPTEEYGTMIASPFYVLDQVARCPGVALAHFHEALWWGKQDLFILRKASADFRPLPAFHALREARARRIDDLERELDLQRADATRLRGDVDARERHLAALQGDLDLLRGNVDALHASTSWRVTAPLRALRRLLR